MTIEKLPSGKYRIVQMEHGKRYRVTVDHKPNNAEAIRIMSEEMSKIRRDKYAFGNACDAYIDSRRNILSPSTIRAYNVLKSNLSALHDKNIYELKKQDIQNFINEYSVDHSPKSVKNMSGFISSVLLYHDISLPAPRLPKVIRKEPYIPTEDEVKRIFEYVKGSRYECALLLAAMGLRMSEILAITDKDLKGNKLTIDKVKIYGDDNKWQIKPYTKTAKSMRQIVVPDNIVNLIKKNGCAYDGFSAECNNYLSRVERNLGIEHFSPHKLRHFFASYLHQLGYSDKQIQEMGGWETDGVMKTVYRHAMEMEKAKESASEDIGRLFS